MTEGKGVIVQKDHVMRGVFCALGAFFLFTVMNLCAKLLAESGHHIVSIAFWRNALGVVPFFLYLVLTRRVFLLKTQRPLLLSLRVAIGITGLVITLAAVEILPLADATMIFLSSALITPALAFFVLKEAMGWHRWAAILLGMGGVFLVLEPSGQGAWLGVVVAFVAALTHSCVHIFLRLLKGEHSLTLAFYFLLGGAVLTAPFMPFVGRFPEGGMEMLLFLGVAATGSVAQILLAFALKFAPASMVAPLGFSGLLWATLFDVLVWAAVPGWPVFAGAAIIIMAQSYIIYREKRVVRLIEGEDL